MPSISVHDFAGPLRLRAGLLQRRLQGVRIDGRAMLDGAADQIQRARGVAGNGRQRLVQFMRQHRGQLAHGGQARTRLQLFLLLAIQFFDPLAVRNVEHGAHPACLLAVLVHQRRFEDQHGHARAVGALEIGFKLRRGIASQRLDEALLVFLQCFGHPVGHGGQAAQDFLGRITDDLAKRGIDVGDSAFQVARAHACHQRVFHRRAKQHLLAQRTFGHQAA